MKKLGIILSILMLFVLVGLNTAIAADFSVQNITWNSSNCSCSEPIQADVQIFIYDLNSQELIHNSGLITDVEQGYDYYANDEDIRTDCNEPCYKVVVYVTLKDSSGTCCSGNEDDNTTGYALVNDLFTPTTVVLN